MEGVIGLKNKVLLYFLLFLGGARLFISNKRAQKGNLFSHVCVRVCLCMCVTAHVPA